MLTATCCGTEAEVRFFSVAPCYRSIKQSRIVGRYFHPFGRPLEIELLPPDSLFLISLFIFLLSTASVLITTQFSFLFNGPLLLLSFAPFFFFLSYFFSYLFVFVCLSLASAQAPLPLHLRMRLSLHPLIGQSVPTLARSVCRPRRRAIQVHG